MQSSRETVLATLPGTSDRERLVVVLTSGNTGNSQLELRQQSWGEGLGWYTQSSVQVEPSQVAGLRQSLGLGGAFAQVKTPAFAPSAPRKSGSFVPRVVYGDVG